MERNIYKIGKELFITSDEDIKERDWVLFISTNEVIKVPLGGFKGKVCKKIILTTDLDLIKDGVQAIDDEFLEWFVNNPSCDKVEVIPLRKNSGYYDEKDNCHWDFLAYKIIIPKEEPKQETLEEAAENYTKGTLAMSAIRKTAFIKGAKWQIEGYVQFIRHLENQSFEGWAEEEIKGYKTACITIKEKFI